MRLTDDRGDTWIAHFVHRPLAIDKGGPATVCLLHLGACYRHAYEGPCITDSWSGAAWLHPRDGYNKAEGRKLTLARAMAKAGCSRAARTALWASYWAIVGPPKLGLVGPPPSGWGASGGSPGDTPIKRA